MSVTKMKDGKRWYVFLRYKDWTGETRQHKKEGFSRKADAQAYEKEFLARMNGSPDMTLKSLYLLYMEDCKARLRPTTYKNKDFLFHAHVLPHLGELKVDNVTPPVIRKWQNTLLSDKRGYSQTYLKTINNQLSALMNFGVKYYGLKKNPCHIVGSMGRKKADTMQFWTVDEFRRFIAAFDDNSPFACMFALLFWTGMRSGEMFALTQSDFDFSEPSVSITKNFARQGGKDLIMEPKTPKGKRVVLLTQDVADLVQVHISHLYGLRKRDRIFSMANKYSLAKEMTRGCSETGVKKIRVHDLRHSHASLLIELGFSPLLIAERLGHENIETTLQTYSHLYPNKQGQLIEQLEKL